MDLEYSNSSLPPPIQPSFVLVIFWNKVNDRLCLNRKTFYAPTITITSDHWFSKKCLEIRMYNQFHSWYYGDSTTTI